MGPVTFHYHPQATATTILGSKGKKRERLAASCFPDDQTYLFRCKKLKQDTELQPLQGKQLPPRENRCCSTIPRFVEMTLQMQNGNLERIAVNIRSLARRCSVALGQAITPGEIYDACAERRLNSLLLDIGLPAKWRELLNPSMLPPAYIDSIIPFMANNWRRWKQTCDERNIPSLFFPARDGRKCDIEYFKDGAIFVYYTEFAARETVQALAVDLSNTVFNPVVLELTSISRFFVYHTCAQLFDNARGLIRIYRTSQYPENHRFTVLCERYKYTLADFTTKQGKAIPLPPSARHLHKRGQSSLKKSSQLSFAAKVKIACDLLHGLCRLHENHIVHLSIQPSSIFVHPEYDKPAEAALGHFEFSYIYDPTTAKDPRSTDLKPEFLAPEVHNTPDSRAKFILPNNPFLCDVWSLGACFRLLFGSEGLPDKIFQAVAGMTHPDLSDRLSAAKALTLFEEIEKTMA